MLDYKGFLFIKVFISNEHFCSLEMKTSSTADCRLYRPRLACSIQLWGDSQLYMYPDFLLHLEALAPPAALLLLREISGMN